MGSRCDVTGGIQVPVTLYSYCSARRQNVQLLPSGPQLFSSSAFRESLILLLHMAIPSGKFPGFCSASVKRQGPTRSMLGTGLVLRIWQLMDAG